ncbi:MAG: serine/threonine-protein phosphatase [Eubacterium sp.]|nr:serine/threonine-protein phosphatase [Eubacterium sp.]
MITFELFTDKGNREINEDSIGATEHDGSYLFALADGLGGHGKGEVASAIAVNTAMAIFTENYNSDFISSSMNAIQDEILKRQQESFSYADMKTTMVSLTIDSSGKARWGHIGDSRLYHFRKTRLKERTLDHSVPQMLVSIGEIKEKDIRHHEDRNRLLRVLGTPWNDKSFELSSDVQLKKDDSFLLCSDGFWEFIDEKTMIQFLKKSKTVNEWMTLMVEEVKKNGQGSNMDNNSAIAVWVRA